MKIKIALKINSLLALVLLFSNLMNAQEIISFRLTKHNNIIVKALVNEKDTMNLMFQIAMRDASLSPERLIPAKSVVFKDEISENNTVKIGNLNTESVTFYDNELTGPEADGKIGTSIFKGKIYQIDYDNSRFLVYDKLPDLKDYHKVAVTFNQYGQIFITCDNAIENKSYKADFLLQSGYSGGLLYSNEFTDTNNLSEKL